MRDRQSDRLPRQTRCEGVRIEREIQMGASGGEQSIKASGHWPREQAGHKPATNMTVHAKSALDPRRASTQSSSSRQSENFRSLSGGITPLADAGALLLAATDRVVGLIDRFAGCFTDSRSPELVEHTVATLVGQRIFGIALG